MTHYIKNGAIYSVTSEDALDIHKSLPVGTYTVKQHPMTGEYFLEIIDNFELPGKIYGNTNERAERILNTFQRRQNATGVLLSGEQGSGKTLMAKLLSIKARELGMPTIVINNPWQGEVFNVFMQSIDQPSVVIFDEFEKVYDAEEQEKLLTLLDGVYPSRKLFILTTNDNYRINSRMRNRPGRLFYSIKYKGLDRDFIVEYCNDVLNDKSHIEAICNISLAFSEFNFDILQALVEDMNRYNESPREVMELLNARPEHADSAEYDSVFTRGKDSFKGTWRGNPFTGEITTSWEFDSDDGEDYGYTNFGFKDIVKVDAESGKFVFRNSEGLELTLSRKTRAEFNWDLLY